MKAKKILKTKKSKVNKGAPSGLIISLIVHAAAFFLAGLFVVFTVLPKDDPVFEAPPPVERPKMKLKKPKVKIKKSSQPKPSSRIVAKVKTAKMPEIQLPDLVGTGEGLLGGVGLGGDFMDIPDIGETTLFGDGESSGSDLVVTFYSLAMKRDGSFNSIDWREYAPVLRKFVQSGWNKRVLSKYYQSDEKRYASTICIPPVASMLGPAAFGESKDIGYCWVALYEGKLVSKDDITFRFWGASDDVLDVAVDGEIVLAANLGWNYILCNTIGDDWVSHAPNNRKYQFGNEKLVGGDWIELKAGEPRDFKAIVGESPGGEFYAALLVEVKGETYPLNDFGSPIFPVFTTDPLSWELQDTILENLIEGEANVTNVTTIFRDY